MAKKGWLVFLLVMTLLSINHFYKTSLLVRQAGFIDTPMFIAQAEYFLRSGELYRNPLKTTGDLEEFEPASPWFKFPPPYLLSYMPWASPIPDDLSHEGYGNKLDEKVKSIWLVHVVRYLFSLAILIYLLRPEKSAGFILQGTIAGLLFTPFFESLYGLIFDNLLLLFIACILLLYKTGKNRYVGCIIGLAAMLKIYPAILFLWALAIRSRAVVAYAVPTGILLLLASVQVFGLENHVFYYMRLLPVLLRETSLDGLGNFSVGRLFVEWFSGPEQAMTAFTVFKNTLLFFTASVLWMAKPQEKQDMQEASIKLSLIVCMLLLYLPNYWGNYQLVLLLPVLSLLANAYALDRGWWWQGGIAMVCWFLMVFSSDGGLAYIPFSLMQYHLLVDHAYQYRVFCPLILWLGTAYWLLRKHKKTSQLT